MTSSRINKKDKISWRSKNQLSLSLGGNGKEVTSFQKASWAPMEKNCYAGSMGIARGGESVFWFYRVWIKINVAVGPAWHCIHMLTPYRTRVSERATRCPSVILACEIVSFLSSQENQILFLGKTYRQGHYKRTIITSNISFYFNNSIIIFQSTLIKME